MGFIEVLILVMLVLKLCGLATLTWFQVFCPALVYLIPLVLFFVFGAKIIRR